MSFIYKGEIYEMKPLTLGAKNLLIDLIAERNRLVFESRVNVDTSKKRKYEKHKKRLEARIAECEAGGKDSSQAKKELELLNEQIEDDPELAAIEEYEREQMSLVVMRLIYNKDLMQKMVDAILDKPVTLDYADPGNDEFLAEVLGAFFFGKLQSKS